MRRIYLDYNATTPVSPEVREAMQPFLAEHFGNPSSSHSLGRACAEAVSDAREQVAALINADADDIFFTSGGTESNNTVLKGVLMRPPAIPHGHLVVSPFEHPSVIVAAEYVSRWGFVVSLLNCDRFGFVEAERVARVIHRETRLVSIMLANNEIGTLQPIAEIAKICHDRGVLVHTDAAQAVGKIPVDVQELGVDMMTIAAHKLYAPKGIGALYVRETVDMESYLHGGPQERGKRAGTENTPYIVAFGKAAKLASSRVQDTAQMIHLRELLFRSLQELMDEPLHRHGIIEGGIDKTLPNTLSVSFPGVVGRELLAAVPEVCASTGAACHDGQVHPSTTLKAIGASQELARGTVRFSCGWYSTEEEIRRAAQLIVAGWERLRKAKS